MNLRSIDLNLLVVLDALVEERNVGRAGDRVGLSASATSHALERLRKLFNDQLLIRSVNGMEPTPRALQIAGPVRDALREIQAALAPSVFDPASADIEFTIAVENYGTVALLPALMEMMRREAPNIRLNIVSGSVQEVLNNIDHGRTDTAFGRFDKLPDRFMTLRLMEDNYVVAMRRSHELAQGELSLDAYLRAPHLLINVTNVTVDPVGEALAAQGLQRKIVMQQPNGLGAMLALAQTDLLATLTHGAARLYADNADICLKPLPVRLPSMEFRQVWHQRLNNSAAHKWLRQKFSAIGAEVERKLRA